MPKLQDAIVAPQGLQINPEVGMSKPAAFLGTYVDLKFLSGLKVARVTLEIPIERSQEFIGMFGTPNKADPAWCALARIDVAALNAPSVPEKSVEPAKVEKASGGEVEPKPKSRIRTASAMCEENLDFRRWLRDGHPTMWTQCYDVDEAERAIRVLKWVLGIKSRKELDTDPEAAARFDALRTSFELRDLVRE